ncbi:MULTISPECIES: GPP34 family phosphoprotein [Nostoc]|uniref:GPP34 family phosphoprotein n=1 Tax=Nostoc flagelliforme FACHB-838 TaxID=2692904 RepID=A0ABR8E445_9NOSO|nr:MULTISPECIES: GPP34 family phosphoprotein [Nostoc]MBD2248506.1 GPP34 family phosphoprotein [Nostoc sp. FACHB-888]MBD2536344.1 GPP34 family phosphoprotein [Nostoc flagelliforme FACHB-838]
MQYLSQDLILLALNPQTGKTRFSFYAALEYGLVGSLLLDLVLQGKLEIDNNNRVIGAITGNTGDEFLDRHLNEVLASSRPRTARFWITRWRRRYRWFQPVVLQNLVDLGVLQRQEQRILGLFPTQRYFLTDESIQREIVQQVREAVLEGIGLDSRMAALISLMQASDLTDAVFRPEERPEARSRIKAIAREELVGQAVSKAIFTVQAATLLGAINVR